MIALLSTLAFGMEDVEPIADPLVEARARTTRGAVLIAAGSLAMGGGIAALVVRQGEPGAVAEDQGGATLMMDLRSVGGAVTLMSGFVAVYAGANELGKAAGLREQARGVTLLPAPGGLVLTGRF